MWPCCFLRFNAVSQCHYHLLTTIFNYFPLISSQKLFPNKFPLCNPSSPSLLTFSDYFVSDDLSTFVRKSLCQKPKRNEAFSRPRRQETERVFRQGILEKSRSYRLQARPCSWSGNAIGALPKIN